MLINILTYRACERGLLFQTNNHGYDKAYDNRIPHKGDPSSTVSIRTHSDILWLQKESIGKIHLNSWPSSKKTPSDILAFLDGSLASSTSFVMLVSRIATDSHGELFPAETVDGSGGILEPKMTAMEERCRRWSWGCLIHRMITLQLIDIINLSFYNI